MSFDWNQSSEDEQDNDVDFSEWVRDQADGTGDRRSGFLSQNSDDDPSDNESVDWEDAASEASQDKKPAALEDNLDRKITINLDASEEITTKPKNQKRRTRKVFRNEVLPLDIQSFLWDLHHAHLLCLTSAVVLASTVCSDELLLAVAHSLIPQKWTISRNLSFPTHKQVREFAEWYFQWIHSVEYSRTLQIEANHRAGAPINVPKRRARSLVRQKRDATEHAFAEDYSSTPISSVERMLQLCAYLSKVNDEDPQLLVEKSFTCCGSDVVQLFTAMCRSMEWRCRYVRVIHPISVDLHVHHPLLESSHNLFKSLAKKSTRRESSISSPETSDIHGSPKFAWAWVEVLCKEQLEENEKAKYRWIPVDPIYRLFDEPDEVEILFYQLSNQSKSRNHRKAVSYVVSVEGGSQGGPVHITDVTPRYASSWIATLRKRGGIMKGKSIRNDSRSTWWQHTLNKINNRSSTNPDKVSSSSTSGKKEPEAILVDSEDELDDGASPSIEDMAEIEEKRELLKSTNNEALPTSKAAFKSHPLYVLQSQLGASEVLAPDANKRICGVFKGELVYRRSDLSVALPEKKWLYKGRKVKESELAHPIKRIKARKKPASKKFVALQSYHVGDGNDGSEERRQQDLADASTPLSDGTEALYAVWQTDSWSPAPVGPSDEIPVNEYKNVELALLNPGLVHVTLPGVATTAKKLGIPYAPCLLGFEGHGGNRTPSIRGIVVHAHNEELIREATTEVTQYEIQEREDDRKRRIRLRWKKLMVGILTDERLKQDYC